jgi:hypothetical protein
MVEAMPNDSIGVGSVYTGAICEVGCSRAANVTMCYIYGGHLVSPWNYAIWHLDMCNQMKASEMPRSIKDDG